MMTGLVLVPTPIGNLEDITLRALRVLKEADLVLCEDTRSSGNLLKHFDIRKPLQSYHQFNEHQKVGQLVSRIQDGALIALITDAGTPGISDPGFLLVRECISAGIAVECLPGATALIPALAISGLPCDRFYFEGFLPHKKGRQTRLAELARMEQTIVLYESPFRLLKSLQQLAEALDPERPAVVVRELSKVYEEVVRGTLQEVMSHFSQGTVKGEIVIIVGGRNKKSHDAEN
jgi:16S rRNA (cytidine1402-2'-O)-methyltransferase